MTEYDFSPEALEQSIAKQAQIAKWVDRTNQHIPGNPFVPIPGENSPSEAYYHPPPHTSQPYLQQSQPQQQRPHLTFYSSESQRTVLSPTYTGEISNRHHTKHRNSTGSKSIRFNQYKSNAALPAASVYLTHPPTPQKSVKTPPSLVMMGSGHTVLETNRGPERGRSMHRPNRALSVPKPDRVYLHIPSQLDCFPPPPPFPAGSSGTKYLERDRQLNLDSKRSAINSPEILQSEDAKTDRETASKTSYFHFSKQRPRSYSFNRPSERDPFFSRPYSRPSSRPSSRPPSVGTSPVATPGRWSRSSMPPHWVDPVELYTSLIAQPDVPVSSSRLEKPLPLPPSRRLALHRRAREREWGSMEIWSPHDHPHFVNGPNVKSPPSRRRPSRYSRPPSPHPSSRPSSRSSFSLPLERRSSFSRPPSTSGTVSGPSLRTPHPSLRSPFSYPSTMEYSPMSPITNASSSSLRSTPPVISRHVSDPPSWSQTERQ